MDCFMKKVWEGNGDDAHKYFVRYGKGVYRRRGLLNLHKSAKKIKLKGSFEWCEDFSVFVAELNDGLLFSGIIISKEGLPGFEGKKKKGAFHYEVEGLDSVKVLELQGVAYNLLLDVKAEGIILKTKKKLPKPGKNEDKIDEGFCVLELDLRYWDVVRETFMLPECKKCSIEYTLDIKEIVMPEGEKDFALIREVAKRKGVIVRREVVDGVEKSEEREFEV